MEANVRVNLFNQAEGRTIFVNPFEPEPFDLVDLTLDVTNSTQVYHQRTECVVEALAGAAMVMTDSQALADMVRAVIPGVHVMALPFGLLAEGAPTPRPDKGLRLGLLNHSKDAQANNEFAQELLGELDRPFIVYGPKIKDLEIQEAFGLDAFAAFCLACDVLLLPSRPGIINSPSLPLAAMSAGNAAILADNARGYYDLDGSTGVQLLPHEIGAWRMVLASLEKNPDRLKSMQIRNQAFAQRLNRDSLTRMGLALTEPVGPRQPLSKGCGCPPKADSKKKGVSKPVKVAPPLEQTEPEPEAVAPTKNHPADVLPEPNPVQPTNEKEI